MICNTAQADHGPSAPLDENEVIEEEPNGVIDFSQAVPQKDGSLCITKTKYIEKMEKQPVKECWYLTNGRAFINDVTQILRFSDPPTPSVPLSCHKPFEPVSQKYQSPSPHYT